MKEFGIDDLAEMVGCSAALEDVLARLDDIGAGLAAIHVDAAIAQLRTNIETARLQRNDGFDPELISAYVKPRITH